MIRRKQSEVWQTRTCVQPIALRSHLSSRVGTGGCARRWRSECSPDLDEQAGKISGTNVHRDEGLSGKTLLQVKCIRNNNKEFVSVVVVAAESNAGPWSALWGCGCMLETHAKPASDLSRPYHLVCWCVEAARQPTLHAPRSAHQRLR